MASQPAHLGAGRLTETGNLKPSFRLEPSLFTQDKHTAKYEIWRIARFYLQTCASGGKIRFSLTFSLYGGSPLIWIILDRAYNIFSANKIFKPPAPFWYSRSSVLCGFGQYMLPQMLPWFRLTGSLVAAILVLQIRDFPASFLQSDEWSSIIQISEVASHLF